VIIIFLSYIDVKQQQNDQKLCAKDLGEKWFSFQKLCTKRLGENYSYLWLVSIFGKFSYLGSCSFVLSFF